MFELLGNILFGSILVAGIALVWGLILLLGHFVYKVWI